MCASYGLCGGSVSLLPYGLDPMDEDESQIILHEWMQAEGGDAKITGEHRKNLNPIIHAFHGVREIELA